MFKSLRHIFVYFNVKIYFLSICIVVFALTEGRALAATAEGDGLLSVLHSSQKILIDHPGENVDLFNGQVRQIHIDAEIPGNGGFDLRVMRSYSWRTIEPHEPAGVGWVIGFGRLKAGLLGVGVCGRAYTANYSFELPNGQVESFYRPDTTLPGIYSGLVDPPAYISANLWRLDCITGKTANESGFSVTSPEGTRYEMTTMRGGSSDGLTYMFPEKIVDKFGNYAVISYTKTVATPVVVGNYPIISSVSTNDGRQLSFQYTADYRVSSISTPNGSVWKYGYESFVGGTGKTYYRINVVTRPDGSVWRFEYNPVQTATACSTNWASSGQLKTVIYPWGGSLTYSYGVTSFNGGFLSIACLRVVQSKTSSDGGVWKFNYQMSNKTGDLDITTVTTPSKTIVTKHFGYNTTTSATCWQLGLPVSQVISELSGETLKTDTFTWSDALLSSSAQTPYPYRGGLFCPGVRQPRLVQHGMVMDGVNYKVSNSNFDDFGNARLIKEEGNGAVKNVSKSYCTNTNKWILRQLKGDTIDAGAMGGGTIVREFDPTCVFLASDSRFGVVTKYSWNPDGSLKALTNPRGAVTTYSDYFRGVPKLESQPESISVSRTVGLDGCLLSEKDGEGNVTKYSCDGLNRLTSKQAPLGNSAVISWGINTKTITRGGLVEASYLDGFGRVVKSEIGNLNGQRYVTSFKYDQSGRLIFDSQPAIGSPSLLGKRYAYDALDRIKTESFIDANGGVLATRSFNYMANNSVQTIDERGYVTTRNYVSFSNPDVKFLTGISPPSGLGSNLAIGRNFLGQVTSVSQGKMTRVYGYNGNYYLISVKNPETGTTAYGRDAAGNMTSRTIETGEVVNYSYDAHNRLTNIVYSDSALNVNKAYTKTHKIKKIESAVAGRDYSYDSNGNLIGERLLIDGIDFVSAYEYNGNDQLSSVTYPISGRVVNYNPDTMGRPTLASGYINSVAYWPSGQIQRIEYSNGVITSYGQNNRMWPSTFETKFFDNYYNKNSYFYDGAGNLTSIDDGSDQSNNRVLGYDSLNRLVGMTGPWGGGNVAYDNVGNIVSQNFGVEARNYSYDSNNRLANISGSYSGDFLYDGNGNVISYSDNLYLYDSARNLRCFNCGKDSKVEYWYDGANQRVMISKAGIKKYEFYNSYGNLLVEFTSEGNLVEHIYLGGKRVAHRSSTN